MDHPRFLITPLTLIYGLEPNAGQGECIFCRNKLLTYPPRDSAPTDSTTPTNAETTFRNDNITIDDTKIPLEGVSVRLGFTSQTKVWAPGAALWLITKDSRRPRLNQPLIELLYLHTYN